MSAPPITFIGAGNMAHALISGLLGAGHPASAISAADPLEHQRERLSSLGIEVRAENDVSGAAAVVLAVKPQVLGDVLADLDSLASQQLVISIAAGVPLAGLAAATSAAQPIVRCMPNTPALLGAGVTALHANANVTAAQRALAETVLGAAGQTLWVDDEAQLDAVTAVSGSGPAYFFYLMEAMIEAGASLGLDREAATRLTLETAYGAARMAREGSEPPAQLRENVTSPGGTTARALEILDERGAREMIHAALAGAASRSRELAEEFGRS